MALNMFETSQQILPFNEILILARGNKQNDRKAVKRRKYYTRMHEFFEEWQRNFSKY